MLEAIIEKAFLLKKILDAIKDIVNEASWDCSNTGISVQAMDSSHVSLIQVKLSAVGFQKYCCK
ncbi:proliferating cell nuclear antigen-like protein, partial [Leptotrombidium deliense]